MGIVLSGVLCLKFIVMSMGIWYGFRRCYVGMFLGDRGFLGMGVRDNFSCERKVRAVCG